MKTKSKKPRTWLAWAFVERGKPVKGFIGAAWRKARGYDGPLSWAGSGDEVIRVRVTEIKRRKSK